VRNLNNELKIKSANQSEISLVKIRLPERIFRLVHLEKFWVLLQLLPLKIEIEIFEGVILGNDL
jgi:hypothetical protein